MSNTKKTPLNTHAMAFCHHFWGQTRWLRQTKVQAPFNLFGNLCHEKILSAARLTVGCFADDLV